MKSILITGASTGFGRELATVMLERGWLVYAALRNVDKRKDLFATDQKRFADQLKLVDLDVTNGKQRCKAFALLSEHGKGLDCLINNAGYGLFGALEEISEEQFRAQMEVNFFGAAFLSRDLLPLLRQNRGRIINVSSVLGLCGFPLTSAYCASKFALEGLSEALHYELRPHGVQVCVVSPGAFRTKFSANVVWGRDSSRPGSAYARQTENYRQLKQKLSSGNGNTPKTVVKVLTRLIESKNMPLRVRVGKDAHMTHLVRDFLPQRLATGLMGRVFDRIMMKELSGDKSQ